ncbi:MAG: vanadium-dependent haloperoxidase [Armatimonadetes bacterium]|nr:vanadium-dependent haloperoxidase [Anaerolineae bacterium]
MRRNVAVLFLMILVLSGSITLWAQPAAVSTPAVEMDADFTVEWMQLIYDRVKAQRVDVPTAARIYGYTGITLYIAVAPGMSDAMPLAMLNELPYLPTVDPGAVYDWAAVANAALAVVAPALLADAAPADTPTLNTAPSNATITAFSGEYAAQATRSRRTHGNEVAERSLAYGAALGEVILTWAAADGYEATRAMSYTMPDPENPANWSLSRLGQDAMQPYWGSLRPMVLADADVCAVPLDVPFDHNPFSTFHAQAMEIRDMQPTLTEDQQQIAAFWDERPGESGTAAGHWVDVENQLVDYLDLNLEQAATMYGLLGITFHDAFISTWSLKFQVNLLRPESYIQTYIDPAWQPYRATPPFPAYPSGHSVLGGAVAEVLTGLFGPTAYTDRYGVKYGLRAREYTSFEAAAYENAISRMYGGVHYRVDIENGLEQGRCIGQTIIATLLPDQVP